MNLQKKHNTLWILNEKIVKMKPILNTKVLIIFILKIIIMFYSNCDYSWSESFKKLAWGY